MRRFGINMHNLNTSRSRVRGSMRGMLRASPYTSTSKVQGVDDKVKTSFTADLSPPSAAGDETDDKSKKKSPGPEFVLFPWRDQPAEPFNIWNIFRNMWLDVFSETSVISHAVNDDDVVRGATQAFIATTSAIFQPISKEPIYQYQPLTPSPRDQVFQQKLATFFDDAIKALKSSLDDSCLEVTYKLEDIRSVRIAKKDVIFGANRHSIPKLNTQIGEGKLVRLPNYIGVGVFFWLENSLIGTDSHKGSAFADSIPLDKVPDASLFTLRYGLEVICKETFKVVDPRSDSILQGSAEPVVRTHMLIMETSIRTSREHRSCELSDDWTVVDIDGWLEENEFWVEKSLTQISEQKGM